MRRAGRRGVLLRGWGALQPGQHGSDMLVIDSAPHDYLFERVAAVVHPGGAGTCAASLRAGIPSVLVPGFSDQFFWAQRLVALGVAPPSLRWRTLDAAVLGHAIERAATDTAIRQAARAARRRLRAEDGVGRAVSTIQQYLEAA